MKDFLPSSDIEGAPDPDIEAMSETCGECGRRPRWFIASECGSGKWFIPEKCELGEGILLLEGSKWATYTACPSFQPKEEK